MNKSFPSLATLALMGLAFLLYFEPDKAHFAYATITSTVIGYDIPNGTTLGNGIVGFIVPIAVAGLFVGVPVGLGLKGSSVTFMLKLSLLIGCLVTMLSLNGSSSNELPIAFPIIAGIFFITYLWKGV